MFRSSSGIVLACVLAVCRLACHAEAREDHPAREGWLERLNFYRATAQLPPVDEDADLSRAVSQHARYMVLHEVVKHSENPRDAGASAAGAAAAAVSNLAGSTRLDETDVWAVDLWMQGPFHALGMLDPGLAHVGFGIHHSPRSKIQTAAGLDVIRGRLPAPARTAYPIVWPANGAAVPLTSHMEESPSPLTSCAGYHAPAGLPLIVQLGATTSPARVTGSWIAQFLDKGERPLEHCVFDGSTYRNGDASQQRLGRSILAARGAIVLMPREPLRAGSHYRAVLEVNGRLIDWTFRVIA